MPLDAKPMPYIERLKTIKAEIDARVRAFLPSSSGVADALDDQRRDALEMFVQLARARLLAEVTSYERDSDNQMPLSVLRSGRVEAARELLALMKELGL